ncbi:MAG: glycosyltransferase family 4 protein [Bacteroidales bacterium]
MNVIFFGSSKNIGLTYHFAHTATALSRRLKQKFYLVSTASEQESGLWDVVLEELGNENCIMLEQDDASPESKVEPIIKKGDKTVIHVQGRVQLRLIAPLIKKYHNTVRVVITIHSFRNGTKWRIPYSLYLSFLYKKSVDSCIFLSPFALRSFCGSSFLARKVSIIPFGLKSYEYKEPLSSELSDVVVDCLCNKQLVKGVYLANFLKNKGHYWLIKGLVKPLKEKPDFRVVFLGDTNTAEFARCKKLIVKYGLQDKILIAGRVNRNYIPWILSKCDFALTATGSENAGHNCVEPMLAGLPVIGTRVGSAEFLIQDFVTGFGVKNKDSTALSSSVSTALNNTDLLAIMGKNAKVLADSLYSWENMVDAYIKLYESL